MNLPGLLATDPDRVPGCKFCGAKSMAIAGNGVEFWHPGVNCCAPSAVLQVTWRSQDIRALGDDLDATHHPELRRDIGKILDDAQEDGREAIEALLAYVSNSEELETAIAQCRAMGYEYQFTHARSALHRRAA